MKLKYKKI